jgi:beta-fructofuranosidase
MRPQFHFTARTGWINDPHGITPRDGGYDVFFQYVPGQTVWGPNCHWGHARGADLLSLVEREPALSPGDGDDGIWTGSLLPAPDGPRIFYTSVLVDDVAIGRVRSAAPTDDSWDTWVKGEILLTAPEGMELVGFRDPFIRRDEDAWRIIMGAGDTDGNALALSYVSHDLASWEYEGVALERSTHEREPAWAGAMWECPQIFELDGRFVMLSSAWDRDVLNYAAYAIGSYERGRFTAEAWGRLTYGPSYYAPSFFLDADGRPALSLWMRGVEDLDAGWANAHSVPYRIRLDGDALVAEPHPDLDVYARPVADGAIDGTAADIRWDGGALELRSGDAVLARAERAEAGGGIVVEVAGDRWELPTADGAVRVIVDATAIEFVTDRGLLGLAIPAPASGLQVHGDGVTVHELARPEPR